MKIYIETYGCTLNRADSDSMKALLSERGHQIVEDENSADVVVLNTCTVKDPTHNKTVERIKRLREKGKKTVIAGCMVINRKLMENIAPESPLVWPSARVSITDAVEDAANGNAIHYRETGVSDKRILTAPIARIPIGEGCTGNCNFCHTKFARPVLRSEEEKTILSQIETAAGLGAKELQLTAMDTGAYGLDRGTTLIDLLHLINAVEGDFMVRLGMINPHHASRMRTRLVDEIAGPRFYKFLHMPVQSGSEKVLKEMNRPHTAKDFSDIAKLARKMLGDVSIATDIIVGYPTETEEDFKETLRLIEECRPEVVNISRFSPRPGTKAAKLKQIPVDIVKTRSRELRELVIRLGKQRNEARVGMDEEVIITEKQRDYTGRTKSYRPVAVKNFKGEKGKKVKVRISGFTHTTLIGKV